MRVRFDRTRMFSWILAIVPLTMCRHDLGRAADDGPRMELDSRHRCLGHHRLLAVWHASAAAAVQTVPPRDAQQGTLITIYFLAGGLVAFAVVMVPIARLLVRKEENELQAPLQPQVVVAAGY